ncbi:uncharacterized protein BO80DRAFT_478364 [Aspergillus ibericus CBS 121593]|uniref:Uncharacterized protein n=1 Tax=Aspergillus ibericus CBS 121593 TaxID=1448316 RepID=A0A395HCE7_9EURO|nr:hypothetical protein BO80DRAFT_478364 [Aspergillus ibericus CBS 121593]RAL05390.1 hypothetical protein BO80DRAFT_478364 [Aspergillus ibericus CBS 121593]
MYQLPPPKGFEEMATLEGLPVELHISILFTVPDLGSLGSLILASPAYYDTYQLVKEELLQNLLQEHYAGLINIADAITAIRSKGLYAYNIANKEKIIALLDSQHRSDEIRQREVSSGPLPDEPATIKEIIQLLQLHDMAIRVLEDYSRTTKQPFWIEHNTWANDHLPLALSEIEKRRVFRAFYRLQIYRNIFGSVERAFNQEKTFTSEESWQLFFSTMAPWEIEEFACLFQHYCHKYQGIIREVSDNLIQTGYTFLSELPEDLRVPTATFISDCDDLRYADEVPEQMSSIGPALLGQILRQQQFLARRNLVLVNARGFRYQFYDIGLWPFPDSSRDKVHFLYPADRFDFGTDMHGFRELLRTLPPSERPSIAWERIWLRAESRSPILFHDMFECGSENFYRLWGYALWEDERLRDWATPMLADDYPLWTTTKEWGHYLG